MMEVYYLARIEYIINMIKFGFTFLNIQYSQNLNTQAATIRFLIAQGNHFLVRATMIYRRIAWPGNYKWEVSLHQSYHSSYKHKNCVLISYKPSTYSDFLTLHILFCYLGMFGQAVLWQSLPDQATKKRGSCRSLWILLQRNAIMYSSIFSQC